MKFNGEMWGGFVCLLMRVGFSRGAWWVGDTNHQEQTILTAIWFVELEEIGPSSKLLWNLF